MCSPSPIHRIDRIHNGGGGESAPSPQCDGLQLQRERHTNPSPHFWSAKYDLHDSSLPNFCMNSMIVGVFAMAILV